MSYYGPGARADFQKIVFPREQSIWMKARELEKTRPVESWGRSLAHGLGWAVVMAGLVLVTSYVH